MSVELMALVFRTDLPPRLKLPLLSLADQASEAGVCWPSHEATAARCSISIRQLQRSISDLKNMGAIEVVRRGRRLSNHYVISVGFLTDPPGDTTSTSPHPAGSKEPPGNPVTATVSDDTPDPDPVTRHPRRLTEGDTTLVTGGDTTPTSPPIGTIIKNHQQNRKNDLADKPPSEDTPTAVLSEPLPRKPVWDFMVAEMGLPAVTRLQQTRLGRYDREISAALTAEGIPIETWYTELGRRALAWPEHFPDATLTADALVKHIGPLGRAPLRGDPEQLRRRRITATGEHDATKFTDQTQPPSQLPATGDPS